MNGVIAREKRAIQYSRASRNERLLITQQNGVLDAPLSRRFRGA